MKVIVFEDAEVLAPNQGHKNFSKTGEVIKEGTELEGEPVIVEGMRRGEPFQYKIFKTNDNKFLFIKKIKQMENYNNADAAQTPTTVNFTPVEKSNRQEFIGAIAGAAAGFLYARYKKFDKAKITAWVIGGAAVGYGAAYWMDKKNNKVVIAPSK